MTAREYCGNCYNWKSAESPTHPTVGYCRAEPPTVFRVESNSFDSAQPNMHLFGWCAAWKALGEDPAWRDTEPAAAAETPPSTVVQMNRKARRAQKGRRAP